MELWITVANMEVNSILIYPTYTISASALNSFDLPRFNFALNYRNDEKPRFRKRNVYEKSNSNGTKEKRGLVFDGMF